MPMLVPTSAELRRHIGVDTGSGRSLNDVRCGLVRFGLHGSQSKLLPALVVVLAPLYAIVTDDTVSGFPQRNSQSNALASLAPVAQHAVQKRLLCNQAEKSLDADRLFAKFLPPTRRERPPLAY